MKTLFKIVLCILVCIVILSVFSIGFLMESSSGKVYYLYTLKYPYPEWLFKVSAVPMAITSFVKYRARVFTATPLTSESWKKGIAEGDFIVVGTHGEDGGFLTDDEKWIYPKDDIYTHVSFLYFGVCEVGHRKTVWQAMFPNARIKSSEGLYYPREGARYMLLQSSRDLWSIEK